MDQHPFYYNDHHHQPGFIKVEEAMGMQTEFYDSNTYDSYLSGSSFSGEQQLSSYGKFTFE